MPRNPDFSDSLYIKNTIRKYSIMFRLIMCAYFHKFNLPRKRLYRSRHWCRNPPPAAVVLVLVLVSNRTISFTQLSSYHSYTNTLNLWRQSSICVNKVRQPHANIRIVHVIKLILNKCDKIPKDFRSFHIRFN